MSPVVPHDDLHSPDVADARHIARALTGDDPAPDEVERWMRAVARIALPLARPIDRRLWTLARRGAAWVALVDAGLALTDPWSPVRHRFYLMLAVLEASPAHVARFEARETSPVVAVLKIGLRGALGVVRAIGGLAVVNGARWMAR